MNKKAIIILSVVFALIVAFIWGNSMISTDTSAKLSMFVGDVLRNILGVGDEVSTVGGVSIRKLGHFCEFFALGIATWLLLNFTSLHTVARSAVTAFTGMFVSLLDETIQIFSGRGHSIKDVWIDIGGFAFGVTVSVLAILAVSSIVKKSKNKHKI